MWRGLLQIVVGLTAAAGLLAVGFTWSFRTKFRPVQDAIRRLNRAFTNPRQLRTAGQPGASAAVIHHVGRRTRTPYRTPVVAMPAAGGFVIALPYGAGTDWVRNVVAAGAATVEHDGRRQAVDRPAFVPADLANPLFPAGEQRTHRWFGVEDFLRLEPTADA